MNKFLTALIVGAISTAAFAQSKVVYSYKASVKRLAPVISKIKYSVNTPDLTGRNVDTNQKLFDSFNVVSDTLNGYLIIDACETCTTDGWQQFNDVENNIPELVVVRKGDKEKLAWYFINSVEVQAGVFNKGVGARPAGDGFANGPTSMKNLKSAWMTLAYANTDFGQYVKEQAIYGGNSIPNYALLGQDYSDTTIYHAGFGKVKTITETERGQAGSDGVCDSDPGTPDVVKSCIRIDSISGTLGGIADFNGPCGTAMWDVCNVTSALEGGDPQAVEAVAVSGTWSLKYNSAATKKANSDTGFDAMAALKAKAPVDANVVFEDGIVDRTFGYINADNSYEDAP